MNKINIKTHQAIFAILDIIVEMSAKQKAFQEIVLSSISEDDQEKEKFLKSVDEQAAYNLGLIRARILQYSEVDINRLIDEGFDF